MNPLEEALRISIRELFEDSSFYTTKAERIVTASGGMLDEETEKKWSLLHCISYSKMSPELRQSIFDDLMRACNRRKVPNGLSPILEDKTIPVSVDVPHLLARKEDRW